MMLNRALAAPKLIMSDSMPAKAATSEVTMLVICAATAVISELTSVIALRALEISVKAPEIRPLDVPVIDSIELSAELTRAPPRPMIEPNKFCILPHGLLLGAAFPTEGSVHPELVRPELADACPIAMVRLLTRLVICAVTCDNIGTDGASGDGLKIVDGGLHIGQQDAFDSGRQRGEQGDSGQHIAL